MLFCSCSLQTCSFNHCYYVFSWFSDEVTPAGRTWQLMSTPQNWCDLLSARCSSRSHVGLFGGRQFGFIRFTLVFWHCGTLPLWGLWKFVPSGWWSASEWVSTCCLMAFQFHHWDWERLWLLILSVTCHWWRHASTDDWLICQSRGSVQVLNVCSLITVHAAVSATRMVWTPQTRQWRSVGFTKTTENKATIKEIATVCCEHWWWLTWLLDKIKSF